jgi:hypothetical protein
MPLFMRRRPLLRAAAVGGGAYAMGKHNAARQQEAVEDQQAPAPAPASASSGGISSDAMQKLKELGQLHEQGILTDDEFEQQKQRLLAG